MPTKIHYFFAQNWPLKIWRSVCILAAMTIAACDLFITGFWLNIYTFLFSIGLILLAGLVGFCVSLIFSFIITPIYYLGAKLNGAPFHENDEVQILVGPHKSEVAKIYEIWPDRRQVRLDLGENEKKTVNDVFAYTEIFKPKK